MATFSFGWDVVGGNGRMICFAFVFCFVMLDFI